MMRRALVVAAMLAIGLPVADARAQGGVLLEGLVDLEGWKTDTMSTLLRKNGGAAAALYRLRLWSAVEPWRGVFVFAAGEAEGGAAYDDGELSAELEQGGVRLARHRAFVVDAGKMIHPLGAFGARVMSTRNPLIGVPDGYSPVYPVGLMVSGERETVDYRAALVSLPLTHEGYVPSASPHPRPVIGLGVTPVTGFRIGASATDGPYLNRDLAASQLGSRRWEQYRQRILAADVRYGIGHFDVRSEFAVSTFEVPQQGRIDGHTGYAEARATVTPELFVAVRGELNRYPFIAPVSPTQWVARRTEFRDFEGGVGFWITPSTLAKASYRFDRWTVTPANASFVRPGGHALAVQLSQGFDVVEWARRVVGPTG